MMGTFTVKIDTDNDAFVDDPTPELVRILQVIAETLASGRPYDMFQTIFDANGNDVGRFALKSADYQ